MTVQTNTKIVLTGPELKDAAVKYITSKGIDLPEGFELNFTDYEGDTVSEVCCAVVIIGKTEI